MSVDPFHPPPNMQNVETARRAQVNGLSSDWQSLFNAKGISIRPTTINNSDGAIADTVALMGLHAKNAASSAQVRNALQQAGCLQSGLTEDEVINRVFNYVHSNIKFVEDDRQLEKMFAHPATSQELLITPPVLLSMPQPKGDCDDFSMLVCSMLLAKGVQCDFVTIAANSSQPTEFSHVYCMARTRDGRNIPVDASHGTEAGWETNRQFRKQVWPVFGWRNESRGVGSMSTTNFIATDILSPLLNIAGGDQTKMLAIFAGGGAGIGALLSKNKIEGAIIGGVLGLGSILLITLGVARSGGL